MFKSSIRMQVLPSPFVAHYEVYEEYEEYEEYEVYMKDEG